MQIVSTDFTNASEDTVRRPVHQLKISWSREQNAGGGFAVVGSSTIDGPSPVKGSLDNISKPLLFIIFFLK